MSTSTLIDQLEQEIAVLNARRVAMRTPHDQIQQEMKDLGRESRPDDLDFLRNRDNLWKQKRILETQINDIHDSVATKYAQIGLLQRLKDSPDLQQYLAREWHIC